MKRSRWRRPSPALLVACLALFVALGGTVPAAKRKTRRVDGRVIRVKSLPGNRLEVGSVPGNRLRKRSLPGNRLRKGSVPGNRLRKGSVPGNRLRKGTIPGNRIAPRSLKGAQIDVGTLGRVPSAAHADSADSARHARTAIAADHAADATTVNGHPVGCTRGRRRFAGSCWDLRTSRSPATAIEAAAACAAQGGELPKALTLSAFSKLPGVRLDPAGEWTEDISNFGSVNLFAVVRVDPEGHLLAIASTEHLHYRCVTPLLS